MRVEKVSILNYRAFDELELSFRDPGMEAPYDLVALTGINGCGKTSVLSAIDVAARTSPTRLDREHGRKSDDPIWVEVGLAFSPEEIAALNDVVRATSPGQSPQSSSLFGYAFSRGGPHTRTRRPGSGAFADEPYRNSVRANLEGAWGWKVLLFPHDRGVPPTSVQAIGRDGRPEPTWAGTGGSLKQHLVNLDYVRLKRQEQGLPDPLEPYRAITRRLFDGKVFDRITEEMRVVFRTADGVDVDFDELSSGERAALTLIGGIIRTDLHDSIFLIDEPEQHLHPAWQAALPDVFRELATQLRSQFILATHSVEIAEGVQRLGGAVYDLSPVVAAGPAP